MRTVIERLSNLIERVPKEIDNFSEDLLLFRQPNKWSKKEILGHLCDSASNNHHRIVKIQFEPQPYKVIGYDQNNWMNVQDYQSVPTDEIVQLWVSLNLHFLSVLKKIPQNNYSLLCDIGEKEHVTLEWLVQDYLNHMEHHLKQIFV